MINRAAKAHIKSLAKLFRVVAVTGVRQSGKTTLLKSAFPKYDYYNLEDLNTFDIVRTDPMAFVRAKSRVIIDEVQRLPELLSAIQVSVDERNRTGDFLLSGSQNLLISDKIGQSLAGRAAYQILTPFSIGELGKFGHKDYLKQIFTGFYPAVYADKIPAEIYYAQYLATYVERDMRTLQNVQDLSLFRKFMNLLAGRIGQLINRESLAGDTGISVKTVEQWLSVLEASCLIYRLRPYYANIGKRLVKSQKIYFIDTGLACCLLGINSPQTLETHYLRGGLFENMCVMDIRKQLLNKGNPRDDMYFYRDSNNNEADLLIDGGAGELTPVEIKSAGKFDPSFLKSIKNMKKAFSEAPNIKITDGFLVYTGNQEGDVSGSRLINWLNLKMIAETA
ncbi:MAG: ATP-binding protein [Synergistaceae bacterium]|jgi:predicted AAA+ superfamily ATPase|nr:ATP-binding protein [Synergistaceae bacterium]